MRVIPAIDIRNGQCVRLYQGREEQETVYAHDPVEMAKRWVAAGATALHVADLDGAFQGKPVNIAIAERMKTTTNVPIQIGGGYRAMASVDAAMAAGLDRVILGTAAVYNEDLVRAAVTKYKAALAVSIDVSEDFVAVAGWKEVSKVRYDTLAERMITAGVQTLLYTDTRKDGTLSGPNINGIKQFLRVSQGIPVYVSGGITTVEDIAKLREFEPLGLAGVIIGKALYDHKITFEAALKAAES